MEKETYLSSRHNAQIKFAISLYDRKDRDRTGLFLIEGYREIRRALLGGVEFISLFHAPELFLGTNESDLLEQAVQQGASLYRCDPQLFGKLSYRDRPDGLLAIARQMRKSLLNIPFSPSPLYVVAEAIEKPGNLGTILRSADAVNATGVIICDRCTDPYNPNVVRASTGTLFTLPVLEATSQETLAWLKQQGIRTVATTPDAEIEFTQSNLQGPIAIIVGTEQFGLSKTWLDGAHTQVRIPMLGIADSLNVAMATTLLLYEALRQRRHHLTS